MTQDVVLWVESEAEGEALAARLRRSPRADAAYHGVYHGPGRDHCVIVTIRRRRPRADQTEK